MGFEIILVRYGEIGLKSKQTRRKFELKLKENLEGFLERESINAQVERIWGRFLVKTKEKSALEVLKHQFGVVSFSPAISCPSSLLEIKGKVLPLAENYINKEDTFAVRGRRSGNHDFTSMDVNEKIGEEIVEQTGASVNLDSPDKELFVEVRQEKTFIFTEKLPGPGGLPYGIEGKILLLHDSTLENLKICAWLLGRRGCEVEIACLEEDEEAVKEAVAELSDWFLDIKINPLRKNLYREGESLLDEVGAKALASSKGFSPGNLKEFKEKENKLSTPVIRPLPGLPEKNLSSYKKLIFS